ncbi:LacI family transcriptional regulator [Actinocorallia sp. API 0066]|uniref:LacI family DNA-binding transcriptional regulator n=1 Tax=Actinocorallia sp. API 0066 TaxID=2896846 RepID=UPI001E2FAF2A|nr:LacI family DNA-binding transcriptional regulator [Actinocorallia sp. API 0066]MCD0450499.1 LacI family transcriptional regulator [Actinocorallia sp. API 0066]
MTTLDEIARQAGVSKATVSRVLNERPGVSAATRRTVMTALAVLGYDQPSRLRPRSAGLVGLVVAELQNPVFPMFAQVIEMTLARHGYTAVLCAQTPEGAGEDEYVGMLTDRGVSGIIFVSGLHADSTIDRERYTGLLEQGLPMVFVNGHLKGLGIPTVSCDDVAAGALATRHLTELGHRRIGFLSGPLRYTPVQRRLSGYRAAMAECHGSAPDDLVELGPFGVEGGRTSAGALLRRGATALVCGSDLMALGAIREARRSGLRVPEDVSVVGSDDSPLMTFTDPPLTTVRQPARAMGIAAVRALMDEIKGHPAKPVEYLFEPELIVRSSTRLSAGGRASFVGGTE